MVFGEILFMKEQKKMKIKVTKEIKEYEGIFEEKVVTPFGTSAHIVVSKKHTGKILPLINPTECEYKWILSTEELKKVTEECKRLLKKEDGKLTHYKKNSIESIQNRFHIEDLTRVIDILKQDKGNIPLINKIRKTYNL